MEFSGSITRVESWLCALRDHFQFGYGTSRWFNAIEWLAPFVVDCGISDYLKVRLRSVGVYLKSIGCLAWVANQFFTAFMSLLVCFVKLLSHRQARLCRLDSDSKLVWRKSSDLQESKSFNLPAIRFQSAKVANPFKMQSSALCSDKARKLISSHISPSSKQSQLNLPLSALRTIINS